MPGTVVVTKPREFLDIYRRGAPLLDIYTIAWVADATAATVPDTSLGKILGVLQRIVTDPGTPAPTTLYDITIVDEDGFDVLGGVGANRSATVTEEAEIKMTSFQRIVANTLTFKLAGNAVNSAAGVCRLYVLL